MARAIGVLLLALAAVSAAELQARDSLRPGARVWLDAHNCYPEHERGLDRMEQALAAGVPTAIEQDLVWAVDPTSGQGRPVVSHGLPLTGDEPTLEQLFFDRVAPLMARALRDNQRPTWPLLVLHLDFKTNEPAHHQAIWALLGRYEQWLTTAERTADGQPLSALTPGPLLVLTENGPDQAAHFHDQVPVGARLRLFGTVPSPDMAPAATPEAGAAAAIAAAPDRLMPSGVTSYRRWVNFPWAVVERGGQTLAEAWTPADAARLEALVDRAHTLGLLIRFYTLNGHDPADQNGWTPSYNFGAVERARERWRASIKAGVDFIATDQYAQLAQLLREGRQY